MWCSVVQWSSCSPLTRCTIPSACHTKWSRHVVLFAFCFGNVLRAAAACTFSTRHLPKMVRTCGAFHILSWKCASRHNCVHLFDNSNSKSGPGTMCFVDLDLEMCFAPQCRAPTSKWSGWEWCVFWIWPWRWASSPNDLNGVQLFISHLVRWLRTRRFFEPTFRTSEATNHWRNRMLCDLTTLWSTLISLSFLTFFSGSCHLCFSSVHTVGSLTSILPSAS